MILSSVNSIYSKMKPIQAWKSIFFLQGLTLLFLLYSEWVFFATAPSFVSALSRFQQFRLLIVSPAAPLFVSLMFVFVLALLDFVLKNRFGGLLRVFARTLSGFVLASALLLLTENFTITVFGFGIRSTQGIWRFLYLIFFLILFAKSYRVLHSLEQHFTERNPRAVHWGIATLVGLLIAGSMIGYFFIRKSHQRIEMQGKPGMELPNILLIGAEGLENDHLALFGYHRQTTPFLDQFARQGLVFHNAFANCGVTRGSLTSILTGKLPTQTHVIRQPDILTDSDAFQHFPGVLKSLGYRNFQITLRHYADAYDLNFLNAFHWVNSRTIQGEEVNEKISDLLGQDSAFFLQLTFGRLAERFEHICGGRPMSDPFAEVTKGKDNLSKRHSPDSERLKDLFHLCRTSNQPFFAHIHLMGTHGGKFWPTKRIFSAGKKQFEFWMDDFYDDTILEFDHAFKQIILFIQKARFRNTVVVLYSDHAAKHAVDKPVPLIFWFPNQELKGDQFANVQLIDIAPTLLDYLKVPKPEWMEGESLLSSNLNACRWILNVNEVPANIRDVSGPFRTLGSIGVIVCDRFFNLVVADDKLIPTMVNSPVQNCHQCIIPTESETRRYFVRHLVERGYPGDLLANSKDTIEDRGL